MDSIDSSTENDSVLDSSKCSNDEETNLELNTVQNPQSDAEDEKCEDGAIDTSYGDKSPTSEEGTDVDAEPENKQIESKSGKLNLSDQEFLHDVDSSDGEVNEEENRGGCNKKSSERCTTSEYRTRCEKRREDEGNDEVEEVEERENEEAIEEGSDEILEFKEQEEESNESDLIELQEENSQQQTSEIDLMQSDDEEEESKEKTEVKDIVQTDANDENSCHGIRIDIDDSEDNINSDNESNSIEINDGDGGDDVKEINLASPETENIRKSRDKEIVTISDEESGNSSRDVQELGNNKEINVVQKAEEAEEERDEIINIDDDEEMQDEIRFQDGVTKGSPNGESECITEQNTSDQVKIEEERKEKVIDDFEVSDTEIDSSPLGDGQMNANNRVEEELQNGAEENSGDELKIDIDGYDDDGNDDDHDGDDDGDDDDDSGSQHSEQAGKNARQENEVGDKSPRQEDDVHDKIVGQRDDVDALGNYDALSPTKINMPPKSPAYSNQKVHDTNSFSKDDINTIRCEFSKNDHRPEVTRVNGHAPSSSYKSERVQNEEDKEDESCDLEGVKAQTNQQSPLTRLTSPFAQRQVQPAATEDEDSRFSISSSVSSTATSSSHQLVIDHPCYRSSVEDVGDTGRITNNEQKILPPLGINSKRKLSDSSYISVSQPPPKLLHLESKADETSYEKLDEKNFVLNGEYHTDSISASSDLGKPDEFSEFKPKQRENSVEKSEVLADKISKEAEVVSRHESLNETLSEATVEPRTHKTAAVSEKLCEDAPVQSSPLLNSLLLKKQSQLTEDSKESPSDSVNKTKYFCFNCKTGSYETITALDEHQRFCLTHKASFLTAAENATQATPPVSAQQSFKSMEKAKTVSTSGCQDAVSEKKCYYKCSSCETFHENWNLFLHIREIHNRHVCLYCLRMFPTAEKLSMHLEIKHDLEQNHYNSEEALRQSVKLLQHSASETRFLMCCTCQHVFHEDEPFSDHTCNEFIQVCAMCGQKGRHTNQCKAQNESKRSKIKKKSKSRGLSNASLPHKSSPHNLTSSGDASTLPQLLATVNSNTESQVPSTHVHNIFQPSTPTFFNKSSTHHRSPLHQNEESNKSSCNMVIDDTCNNATNYDRGNQRKAFESLKEYHRIKQPVLPTDRHQISEPMTEKSEPQQRLIVPKFKLRVPKEFQKSVDAAISSTESEDDDDGTLDQEDTDKHSPSNARTTTATMRDDVDNETTSGSVTDLKRSQTSESKQHSVVEGEDSQEVPDSDVARILQEIERTKADIERTKETLQTSSAKTIAPTTKLSTPVRSGSRADGEHSWSPTPPASPNARWGKKSELNPPSREASPLSPVQFMLPPRSSMQWKRRDTIGSDVMDIDETISARPTQCIEGSNKQPEADISNSEFSDAKQNSSTDASSNDTDSNTSNANLEETAKSASPTRDREQSSDTCQDALKQERSVGSNITPKNKEALFSEHKRSQTEISGLGFEVESPTVREAETEPITHSIAPSTPPQPPSDGIPVADEDTIIVDLQLDRPLEKFEVVEFVRICLKAVYPLCLYCNHARRIAVNGKSLVLHLIAQHRFAATVDSITAEELKPETIVAKLKSYLPTLEEHYFNLYSYCTYGDGAFTQHFNEHVFECFQCRFETTTFKELYLHNRKMHLRCAILCFMCRSNFFTFSEILCHVCPGEPHKISIFDIKFRCCLCDTDNIPSPFRLMVHLRKRHCACDVCLEDCQDQGRLSSHVWKHKQHHICYRCGIAYRNKADISKHLFWKHGTESIICKTCLQKRWRHVYHFCVLPRNFICDICNVYFSRATFLTVHKRIHSGDLRYPCADENCGQRFISRRLLVKHTHEHQLSGMSAKAIEFSTSEETKKEAAAGDTDEISELKTDESTKVKDVMSNDINSNLKSVIDGTTTLSAEKTKLETEDSKSTIALATSKSKSRQRKKQKNKRSKESLEDLNLTAPNLSESDSSDDSEAEYKSISDDSLVPKVMLSSPSETEDEKEEDQSTKRKTSSPSTDNKVLNIWKNLIQGQASGDADVKISESNEKEEVSKEDFTSFILQVVLSEHDYCKTFEPEPEKLTTIPTPSAPASPYKRKASKSPRRNALERRSGASSSSSSDSSSSDTDSSSSGSNTSSSSSNSDSSSSSSSSTDSSTASPTSKKRKRKKSERDRMRRKSPSASPTKKHHHEGSRRDKKTVGNDGDVPMERTQPPTTRSQTPPRELLYNESDLETAESDTDEDFYDEHPQKLATELLAQKRAQLMAQTRLSPSHNYDIVENSRPSTPSLPEEFVRENKIKPKKKKRERKSSNRPVCNTPALNATSDKTGPEAAPYYGSMRSTANSLVAYEFQRHASAAVSKPPAPQLNTSSHPVVVHPVTARPIGQPYVGHMSEGSSCSDADGSLKRPKRTRRPNKFYGYTSDEDNSTSGLGQPLIKPLPPPQYTWSKEDLPPPSKSVVNNHKSKNPLQTGSGTKSKKRRLANGDKTAKRKRQPVASSELPPIPTLKIRSSQMGVASASAADTNHSRIYSPIRQSDDIDEDAMKSSDSSSDDEMTQRLLPPIGIASTSASARVWNTELQQIPGGLPSTTQSQKASVILPKDPPAPPIPHASAFNQKIPPALLPNPDFATLQYFRANNIRYPIRPPAGARQAREGESVYCYCRCPYDEVSEMIACDGEDCLIEWFHFECVGIMLAPQGKWFCAECRPKYSEELYPTRTA